jgi:hypothetical protein
MRSLIALGLVAGLSAPAMARPDHHRPPPPGALRSDMQMRMPTEMRVDKPEPWMRAERPQPERPPTSAQRADLPVKTEVMMKAHPGDSREVAAKPQGLAAQPTAAAKPADDRFGRPEAKPAVPLKTDVVIKMQAGDRTESAPAARSAAHAAGGGDKQPMTAKDKEMLCKMVGVCLPSGQHSDDPQDLVK